MNLRKKIAQLAILLLIISGSTGIVTAQQDPMYTQYMDNLLIVNPGYAGTKEIGNFMVVARNQWVAFDGAPRTRTFSFHTPVKDLSLGVGFSVLSDKIGPLSQTGLYFDYSYWLRLNQDFRLSLGLKGGFSFYRADLTSLETIDPDPIYQRDIFKNFLPNFGVGGFLFSEKTYVGISVPKLIENNISRDDYSSEYVGKEKIHFYLMGGHIFTVNEFIKIKSHSMLKVVKNAPVSLDLTALAGLKDQFWFGTMMRFGDSWGLLAQVNATESLLIGYSYDLSFSKLNTFNNGTHEVMVSYNLNFFK
ncbi:MAG: type IX secretion system membrane protein PorP/SprF [Bacteroidales bacterium]|nr:type IX secretion system membrane protein PorP/SprF [Bacteroidales bacterium]